MALSDYVNQVQQLYIAYFGRPADQAGLQYWAQIVDAAGGSVASVISGFAASAESQALFGNKTPADTVTAIYQNLFGRAPEPAGLAYWSNLLSAGAVSASQIALAVLQGAQGSDATTISNKLTVAKAFTNAMDTAAEMAGYKTADAAASARSFLARVTSSSASVNALLGEVDNAVASATGTPAPPPPEPPGPTFTASKDGANAVTFSGAGATITASFASATYTFVSGNAATISGTVASISVPTGTVLTVASAVASGISFPGAGTVKLTDTTASAATLKAIEAATTGLVDASSVTAFNGSALDAQLLLVTNNGSSGDKIKTAANVAVTLSNTGVNAATLKAVEAATTGLVDASNATSLNAATVADAVLLLVTNNGSSGDKVKTAANVAVTLTGSTATAADLKAIEAATTGLVDASTVTSITSASAADAVLLLVTNNGSTGDKIKTAANVAVTLSDTTATAANLKALEASTTGLVDASTITSITAAPLADALLLLVTNNGSSGDKIQTAANVAVTLSDTTASAADLKALEAATTGLVDASSVTSITAASVADAVLLLVTNNGGSGDKIQTATNVAVTLSGTTASVQDLNSLDAATTGLVSGGSVLTSLSGTVSDVKTALEAITTGTQLSAANLSSVTLTDVIDIPASNMFANVTFSNNTTLTLANVAFNNLSLGGSTVAAGKVLTIDGSALTSGFTVDGSGLDSGSLVFLGGSGGDILGGSPRADTFTGGGGNDIYTYYPGNQSTLAAMDTITDYRAAGNDAINTSAFTAVMGSATNQVQDLSAQASLSAATGLAATGNTTNHGLMVFLWGGDTYVAVEHLGSGSTLAAGDFIAKLSGTPFAAGTNIGTLGLFGVT